jgi:hypothetical protein
MAKKSKNTDEKESPGKVTTDHETIRKWVEERDGTPSMVKGTMKEGTGLLRIDFGEQEPNLAPVSWEDFFRTFDESDLVFLYQEKTADGKVSRFFKFIQRDTNDTDDDTEEGEAEEDEME